MKRRIRSVIIITLALGTLQLAGEAVNVADDDAGQSAYSGGWNDGSNGGSGFGKWTFLKEGNDADRHSGAYIANSKENADLGSIAASGKAFGLYANGVGFEQSIAYRPLEKPLEAGDSFSFMVQTGPFQKKFARDASEPSSVGLVLRTSTRAPTIDDTKDIAFEFGCYEGKSNYQIHDGSDNPDTGIPFANTGVSVTVTIVGDDAYELEIQTMKDKKLTKLGRRKLMTSSPVQSFVVFNRNSEKNDAYFNQFQVARDVP